MDVKLCPQNTSVFKSGQLHAPTTSLGKLKQPFTFALLYTMPAAGSEMWNFNLFWPHSIPWHCWSIRKAYSVVWVWFASCYFEFFRNRFQWDILEPQNHRKIYLEGTSRGSVFQIPVKVRLIAELHRALSSWILKVSEDGDSTVFLGTRASAWPLSWWNRLSLCPARTLSSL